VQPVRDISTDSSPSGDNITEMVCIMNLQYVTIIKGTTPLSLGGFFISQIPFYVSVEIK
jgi:hypothetical protein